MLMAVSDVVLGLLVASRRTRPILTAVLTWRSGSGAKRIFTLLYGLVLRMFANAGRSSSGRLGYPAPRSDSEKNNAFMTYRMLQGLGRTVLFPGLSVDSRRYAQSKTT